MSLTVSHCGEEPPQRSCGQKKGDLLVSSSASLTLQTWPLSPVALASSRDANVLTGTCLQGEVLQSGVAAGGHRLLVLGGFFVFWFFFFMSPSGDFFSSLNQWVTTPERQCGFWKLIAP